MDFSSFVIGFCCGVVAAGCLFTLVFSGKIKTLAIGKEGLKIEAKESILPGVDEESSKQFLDVPISGRLRKKEDKPGSKYPRYEEGVPTPGKIPVTPGMVYSFDADFGIDDSDLLALDSLSNEVQLRSLGFYKCQHLTPSSLVQLRSFVHVWDLDLRMTNATDEVLEALTSMKSLRILNLQGCNCSTDAVEHFRSNLPACKVRT